MEQLVFADNLIYRCNIIELLDQDYYTFYSHLTYKSNHLLWPLK